jgi:hypothetical protein
MTPRVVAGFKDFVRLRLRDTEDRLEFYATQVAIRHVAHRSLQSSFNRKLPRFEIQPFYSDKHRKQVLP